MRKVGFITTIPVEILYAAGCVPVDVNNFFITHPAPSVLVRQAEDRGFPRTLCAWIKGNFEAIMKLQLDTVVMVNEGECTNSRKLEELLKAENIRVVPFSYPQDRSAAALQREIEGLADAFGVGMDAVESAKVKIDAVRATVLAIDKAAYELLNVSGTDNFNWLVCSSDFNGDYLKYGASARTYLEDCYVRRRDKYAGHLRLAVIGVPPIMSDFFTIVEEFGGVVVYNEIPHQFAMPSYAKGLVEQYRDFTYPYDAAVRLPVLQTEIARRKIDGVIHYIQSFCPRQIDDMVLKKELPVPYLSIEGDRPGKLDERNQIRIEAFFERIRAKLSR